MKDLLLDAINKYKKQIDYLEIRVQEVEGTAISFRGHEIENVSRPLVRGGSVRAFYRGGWGFTSFNQVDDLASKVKTSIGQAKLIGAKRQGKLFQGEGVVDRVRADFKGGARGVLLSQKVSLLQNYNQLLWSYGGRRVSDTRAGYSDSATRVYFANSEGTYLEQDFPSVSAHFSLNTRKDNLIQQASFSVGDPGNFAIVKRLEPRIKKTAQMAVRLLNASPVKAGNYTVVLDPHLAGTFIHEAFGHLSEADHVYENPGLKKIMVLGRKVASTQLSVVDDPTLPGLRGSFKYDDEGICARKSYLIKKGVLIGRLHNRETAAKMGEPVTGNARAASFSDRPQVRMSNTYIEPGQIAFKDMIKDIELGVYACDALAGQTDREMFTFTAKWGFMIRKGELAELVRDVKLSGNLFTTLKNIEAVGNDLKIGRTAGACGKGGQWVPVATGGPHLRIRSVTVGGQ